MENSNSSGCLAQQAERQHRGKHVLEEWYKIPSVVLLRGLPG